MFKLFRILTAVVFAVHIMVGCCWHHAHACESKDDVQPTYGQCPDSHASGADNSHRGPQDCQGSQCSFVSSISPNSHLLVQPSQAFVPVLLTDQPSLVGAGSKQHCFATGRLLPSVRLYLVNQVLLI
jgi:hypothetical protein